MQRCRFAFADQAVVFRPQAERQTHQFRALPSDARRASALDPSPAPLVIRLWPERWCMPVVMKKRYPKQISPLVSIPNSAQAYHCQGFARAFGGRPREALETPRSSVRLGPFDPSMPHFSMCSPARQYWMGDYPGRGGDGTSPAPLLPEFPKPLPYADCGAGTDRAG